MVVAFFRAVGALSEPPMRRVVALSFALAVVTFAALWLADNIGSFFEGGGAAFYHSPIQPQPVHPPRAELAARGERV